MATRGETVINELLTKVGLLGVVEATAAAQAYDKTLDGVSVSSDGVTKAQLSLEKSLTGTVAKYSEVSRAAAELAKVQNLVNRTQQQGTGTDEQRTIALAGATERLVQALQKQAALKGTLADTPVVHPSAIGAANDMVAAIRGVGPAMATGGAAAAGASKNFGLASHQIQNLAFQLNDLIVQVGSGQGLFRPLLQQGAQVQQILSMSEGGVGGVLRGVAGALGRIGPLGFAAFGAAGLAGAVGISSVALASHGAELQRSEARLRAFSSRSTEIIAISQTLATTLGVSATGGFRDLTENALRFGQAMGVIDVQSFVTNFGNLALSQHATAESADAAAAAFARLAQQGNLTSGDLIKFAQEFPQFAGVMAQALRVPQDQLLRMSTTIPVAEKALTNAINNMGAAADANVRPWNQLTASIGTFVDNAAKLASISLDKFLDTTAKEVYALAGAWSAAVDAVEKYARQILGLPAAPSGPAAPTATAPQSGGRASALPSDYYGNRDAQGFLTDSMDKVAAATQQTAGNTEGSAKDEGIWRIYQNAEQVKARVAETAANTAATVTAIGGLGGKLDSIRSVNAATFSTPTRTPVGSFEASSADPAFRNYILYMKHINALYGGDGGASAGPGSGPGKDAILAGLGGATQALDGLADAGTKAADTLAPLDVGQIGAPIQSKIDTLRSQQETALSRAYRPDPYAEKNPNFFYSGERIFKEGQDKLYDGLQRQINKLEALQASLGTLVNQGNALPQTLVNALISAGFGNIAQQIVSAFKTSAPASATPSPTAVQGPALSTSGAGATSTTSPRAPGFNSLGGGFKLF